MVDQQFAQLLQQKYALTQVADKAATADSTVYYAADQWGNSPVEVELFHTPVGSDRASSISQLAGGLRWLEDPAVVTIRDCGVTDDGKLYVLRNEASGSTLRSIVDSRVNQGSPFTNTEAHNLLAPVASAVDHYNNADHADLLARSINVDYMLVQQGNQNVPVTLLLAGPTPEVTSSPAENRRKFAEVVSQLTAKPVDRDLLDSVDSARGYLDRIAYPQPSQPQQQTAESPKQAKADRPKQHFPDTNPGFAAVDAQQYPQQQYQQHYQQPQQYGYSYPGYGQQPQPQPQPQPQSQQAAPAPKKSTGKTIGLTAAILLALAGIGAGGWWLWDNQGEEWGAKEQEMADTFPAIIAEQNGQRGWMNMKCESLPAENGQEARIRCANSTLGVSIMDYGTEEKRDEQLPDTDAEVIGNDVCSARSYEMEGVNPPAYRIAPEGADARYLFVVNGDKAEEQRMYLNLCEKSRD